MKAIRKLAERESALKAMAREKLRGYRREKYLRSDRRPWSYGYDEYKASFIETALKDSRLMQRFESSSELPAGYGYRLDERCVELPWALSHIQSDGPRLLDAGSSLNHEFALGAPALANKKMSIMTLAPEGAAYWQRGISYVFGDLREIDFRDGWFDSVACISTIEHVGMDNALYSKNPDISRPGDTKDFIRAVQEMKRILRPGGALYITFPFGRYENHGFFQQFDAALTDALIGAFAPPRHEETIFRYEPEGWVLADRAGCAACEYYNVHKSKYFDPSSTLDYAPDYAAGVRAVACLELRK